mgnify:CR=1 FL=1
MKFADFKYKEFLQEMRKDQNPILEDLKEYHTTRNVHFELKLTEGQVARFLEARGFGNVANLTGGILAWGRDVDPSLQAY